MRKRFAGVARETTQRELRPVGTLIYREKTEVPIKDGKGSRKQLS